MAKRWCFAGGALCIAMATAALWGRQGIVHLRDGSPPIAGDVDDSGPASDSVTINLHGVQTTIPRANISSIEYPSSLDDQFKVRIAKLDPKDVSGRLEVSQWAMDNNRYDLARRAAAQALAIDPGNTAAGDMMRTINRQEALTPVGSAPTSGPSDAMGFNGGPPALPAVPAPSVMGPHYLTADDINLIRQQEMKPGDNLRVAFAHDVRKRFLAAGGDDAQAYMAMTPMMQAEEILNRGAPEMAKDVRIMSDPSSMTDFRSRVQTIVLAGCAAAGCHNTQTSAGGLGLYTNDTATAAWYTNFYILQTYTRRGPASSGGLIQRQMIDRTYPNKSLLVQYGLPAALADTPHPRVPNLMQFYTGLMDPRLQVVVNWMGMSLKPTEPDLTGIHYNPVAPQPTPSTRPLPQ